MHTLQTQIRRLLLKVYTVYRSTMYIKKQLHKKQNLVQKSMEENF